MSATTSPNITDDALPDRMTSEEIRASTSLASIFALRMLGLFLILPVFAVHARGLPGGDNTTLVGLAIGIYGLTQACLQIPFGIASDKLGRKPVIIVGLILFALGSFIAAYATDLQQIIIGRSIQGAGAISAAVTAFIADATREEHRTKAMAMVGGSIGLTFAGSMVASPLLYPIIGMKGLFEMTGILSILAIGVVLWVVPAAKPVQASALGDKIPFMDVLMNPELLRLNVGIFVLHLVQMAMFVVVPIAIVDALGLPVNEHWKVYLPVVIVSFVLMVPPIIVAEKKGKMKQIFLTAIAIMALVQLGLMIWLYQSTLLVALLLAFFIAFNVLEATLPSMVSRVAPPAAKGMALGIYNTTQAFGLFVGGAVGGWLSKTYDYHAVFAMGVALVVAWFIIAKPMKNLPVRQKKQAAPVSQQASA